MTFLNDLDLSVQWAYSPLEPSISRIYKLVLDMYESIYLLFIIHHIQNDWRCWERERDKLYIVFLSTWIYTSTWHVHTSRFNPYHYLWDTWQCPCVQTVQHGVRKSCHTDRLLGDLHPDYKTGPPTKSITNQILQIGPLWILQVCELWHLNITIIQSLNEQQRCQR